MRTLQQLNKLIRDLKVEIDESEDYTVLSDLANCLISIYKEYEYIDANTTQEPHYIQIGGAKVLYVPPTNEEHIEDIYTMFNTYFKDIQVTGNIENDITLLIAYVTDIYIQGDK